MARYVPSFWVAAYLKKLEMPGNLMSLRFDVVRELSGQKPCEGKCQWFVVKFIF